MTKIDFLHIGYHKTASTWFQLFGYRNHPRIFMANECTTPAETYFITNFVECGDFHFQKEKFIEEFNNFISSDPIPQKEGSVYGICEENLSGHPWTGLGGKALADRIFEVFGSPKIIVTIRNQISMTASLHSNYIKTGGVKSMRGLRGDKILPGRFLATKLCYSDLIEYYVTRCGREQVKVLCYEEMVEDMQGVMDDISGFLGVERFGYPREILGRKPNVALSIPSEYAMRLLNLFNIEGRMRDKFVALADSHIFKSWKRSRESVESLITKEEKYLWRQSNRITQKYVGKDLARYGYIL